jgi:hypothetical protein
LRVSVVVPVRDDPHVDALLASLDAQRDAPEFEVLVAMDGSRRRPRVPAALPARLLRLPALGPYPARNAAVREAKGEVLLFTDSDCLCPPDWIATAARFFEDATVMAVQGSSRASEESRLSRLIQLEYDRYVASHAAAGYRHFCNTVISPFAPPSRERLAGSLPRGGDAVYGWLLEGAVTIHYEPSWWVAHCHPASRWDEARRAFAQGKNGALWGRELGLDLFGSGPADDSGWRRPGARLLFATRGRPVARRAASLALLPAAALFAALSAVLPGQAGAGAFGRFRRAAHLAGRLSTER